MEKREERGRGRERKREYVLVIVWSYCVSVCDKYMFFDPTTFAVACTCTCVYLQATQPLLYFPLATINCHLYNSNSHNHAYAISCEKLIDTCIATGCQKVVAISHFCCQQLWSNNQ